MSSLNGSPGLPPTPLSRGRKPHYRAYAASYRGMFRKLWPVLNLVLVMLLIMRRLDMGMKGVDEAAACVAPPAKEVEVDDSCTVECGPHGRCKDGGCKCDVGWGGVVCGDALCTNDCNGHGVCRDGLCICRREWAGVDCAVEVAELQVERMIEKLGAPYHKIEGREDAGRFEDEVELAIHTKSYKRYQKSLCRTKACIQTWITQLAQLMPFLPRDDYRPHFKTCAVVSSAKQLVYGANSSHVPAGGRNGGGGHSGRGGKKKVSKKWARRDHVGAQIDRHTMVLRLDNAPTEGYEPWVGSRTTHRLVAQDYARLVLNMLGTEIVVNQTKSVVTASTWWAGGYPGVEKVTYMLAVPGQESTHQLRAPEHNGYAPFTEVFPGSRRLLISPIFLKRALDAHEKVREHVRLLGLGCYKASPRLPALLLAVFWAMQVCGHVDLYGASVGVPAGPDGLGGSGGPPAKITRDRKYRVRYRGGDGASAGGECCYYPREEGYVAEAPLCDELSRRHAMRLLLETGRLRVYE